LKSKPNPPDPEKLATSRRHAARLLDQSEGTLRNWERRGVGPPFVRLPGGRTVLYPLSQLRSFLERNAIEPRDAA